MTRVLVFFFCLFFFHILLIVLLVLRATVPYVLSYRCMINCFLVAAVGFGLQYDISYGLQYCSLFADSADLV